MFVMSNNPIYEIGGIMALLPMAFAGIRGRLRADATSWALLIAALVGGSLPAAEEINSGWSSGLGPSLDVSAAVLLLVYAIAAMFMHGAIRLAGLVGPYAVILLCLGWLISAFEPARSETVVASAWLASHVLFAIASYGALTLAALAAGAVLLEEHALKARVKSWAGRVLPPLDESEATQNALLKASALLMFLALVTGAANEYVNQGRLLEFSHKILLSILAFLVLCLLLYLHHRTGMRGRRAARWLLAGFLLLTLAYPGVKFVREFLIG